MIKYHKYKGIRMREWVEENRWVAFTLIASLVITMIHIIIISILL